MRVFDSQAIERDLESLAEYIAADNPRRAVSFLREIYAEIERIGKNPLLYQLRPDIGSDARLAVIGRYVVLFRVADDVVYIERVVYRGRELQPLFNQ
jgi:plasmid stabilization system protein ParE